MRLATTISNVTNRSLPHDDVVCGYRLPKGTTISILSRAIHRNEMIWEKPFEFVPERWLGASKTVEELSKNMCGFSFGPRRCLGKEFAINEILMTLAYLVPKYKIRFINEDRKSLEELLNETYDNFSLTHENGLYFEISSR